MAQDLIQKRIAQQRLDLVRKAAGKVADNQSADIAAELQSVELHDKLLAAMPPSRRKELVTAGILGMACLAIVSVAWSYRLHATRVTMVVDTDFVSLQLEAPWTWPAALTLRDAPIRLVDFSTIELPSPDGQIVTLTENPWAEITGGRASLSRITLGQGGELLVEREDSGRVYLMGRGAKFAGELAIWGNLDVSAGAAGNNTAFDGSMNLVDAETISFSAEGKGVVPARLELLPAEPSLLSSLRVNKLSFAKEVQDQPGSIVFASTVLGGKLSLDDLGTEIALDFGDRLKLAGVSGLVHEIRLGDKMTVTFNGVVSHVVVGADDRTPTLIEYVYHNERLIFFWSAITFVGGTLWSARKFLIR